MKRVLSLSLCAALTLSLMTACQGGVSPSPGPTASPPVGEAVARVGDTTIPYGDLAQQMVMYEAMYGSMSGQFSQEELQEKLRTAALGAVEQLITQQILRNKIDEYGISLTPEEQAEAQGAWEASLASVTASVRATYPELEGADLDSMVQIALEASGLQEAAVVESAAQSTLVAKLKEAVLSQVDGPTAAQVEEAYADLLSQQEERYSADLTSFESDMLSGAPVVYVPQAYRAVQEIYLRFDDEVAALLDQMKAYDTEESDSYEEMLTLEYQKLREAALPELLKQLADGVPFQTLMEQVKPGSSSTYNYVCEDTTRLSESYRSAALSIAAPGQIAGDAVVMDRGYALLYWADALEAGPRPLEAVYGDIEAKLRKDAQNQAWQDAQAQWRAEADVEIYESNLGY